MSIETITTQEHAAAFYIRMRNQAMRGVRWSRSRNSLKGWWIMLAFQWFAISFSWHHHPSQVSPESHYKGFHFYWTPTPEEELEPGSLLWKNRKDFGIY